MLNRKKSGAVGEIKFMFDIQINSVTLKKPGQSLEKDCTVSVLIERGSKHHINTTEKEAKVGSTGDAVIIIAETLSLEATMYQEASGTYQEKVGKLTVRKRKRGMMQSHVAIGQTSLPLHAFIEEGTQPIDRTFLLEQSAFPGSQIQLVIRYRRLDGKPALSSSASQQSINTSDHGFSAPSPAAAPAAPAAAAPNATKAPPRLPPSTAPSVSFAASVSRLSLRRRRSLFVSHRCPCRPTHSETQTTHSPAKRPCPTAAIACAARANSPTPSNRRWTAPPSTSTPSAATPSAAARLVRRPPLTNGTIPSTRRLCLRRLCRLRCLQRHPRFPSTTTSSRRRRFRRRFRRRCQPHRRRSPRRSRDRRRATPSARRVHPSPAAHRRRPSKLRRRCRCRRSTRSPSLRRYRPLQRHRLPQPPFLRRSRRRCLLRPSSSPLLPRRQRSTTANRRRPMCPRPSHRRRPSLRHRPSHR